VSATFYDVAYCEGFRMPAVHERFNARRGRRTKTSKGGNRERWGRACAACSDYGILGAAGDFKIKCPSTAVSLKFVHNLNVTAQIMLNGESILLSL
jgi:hypothetical protein